MIISSVPLPPVNVSVVAHEPVALVVTFRVSSPAPPVIVSTIAAPLVVTVTEFAALKAEATTVNVPVPSVSLISRFVSPAFV